MFGKNSEVIWPEDQDIFNLRELGRVAHGKQFKILILPD